MEGKDVARIAREAMWKVPQMQTFGYSDMWIKLEEMSEEFDFYVDDKDMDTVLNAVNGDSDLAEEFLLLASDVQDQIERCKEMFTEAAHDVYGRPSLQDLMDATEKAEADGCAFGDMPYNNDRAFDDCTVALLGSRFQFPMSGFDGYEMDFFPLTDGYEQESATQAAQKRLMRLTKAQIVDIVGKSVAIVLTFNDLRCSYDRLMNAYELIYGKNTKILDAIKEIESLYDAAMEAMKKPKRWRNDTEEYAIHRFESALEHIPPRMWVE